MALYLVATPIGNTQDITLRALDVLSKVDLILAEDTRVTRQLLNRYTDRTFKAQVLRLDDHIRGERLDQIVDRIMSGVETAIVSCAGTPGISDPGESVVEAVAVRNHQQNLPPPLFSKEGNSSLLKREARRDFPQLIPIISVPGPSALAAILSVADFSAEPLAFYGFLPVKKGRQTVLRRLKESSGKHGLAAAVFYESPHRIVRTLKDLAEVFGSETHIVVGRELTKLYEEVWYGTLAEALEHFVKPKGEFTILVQLFSETRKRTS